MRNEPIKILEIGTVLLILSVIIMMVVRNVNIGEGFVDNAILIADGATTQKMNNSFKDLTGKWTKTPTAAIYALIGYNEDEVSEIYCYKCSNNDRYPNKSTGEHDLITGGILIGSCITSHLTGDSWLYVKYTPSGTYEIYIAPSNWPIDIAAEPEEGISILRAGESL